MSTRRYRSPRREAQAEATRQALLDAAHELFLTNGYNATSLRAVAEAAEVSEPTVYKVFGDKPSLLVAVGDRVVSGELATDSPPERDFASELSTKSEPIERIKVAAAWSRMIWEQGMLQFESMLLDAAGTDPRAAEVAEQVWQRKYQENKSLFALVFLPDSLPEDDDFDKAYDVFFALDSAAFVRILIYDRGWTFDEYEQWLVTIMQRLFTRHSAGLHDTA